jgi:hypothetical protein
MYLTKTLYVHADAVNEAVGLVQSSAVSPDL